MLRDLHGPFCISRVMYWEDDEKLLSSLGMSSLMKLEAKS